MARIMVLIHFLGGPGAEIDGLASRIIVEPRASKSP